MSDAPPEKSDTAPPPAIDKKQRRRRRIRIAVLAVLLIFLTIRVGMFLLVGPVLRNVAASYGFDADYRSQELTLIGGDFGLWGLTFTPKSGGEPVFYSDYIRGNLSVAKLFQFKLQVRRAEADGVDLKLERLADGRIPVLEQILATSNQRAVSESEKSARTTLDFTPPLHIEAIRLHHVRADIHDAAVNPPFSTKVLMDVRISDFGSETEKMTFDIDVSSDSVLAAMRMRGEADGNTAQFTATAGISVAGLRPKALSVYFDQLGIRPIASSLDATMTASIAAQPIPDSVTQAKVQLDLSEITLLADQHQSAALKSMSVVAESIGSEAALFNRISAQGGRLHAARGENGLIQFAGLELAGSTKVLSSAPTVVPSTQPTSGAYAISLGAISMEDMIIALEDSAVSPPAHLEFILNKITTTGALLSSANPDSRVEISADLAMPGIVQRMVVNGSSAPLSASRSADLTFSAEGIRPDALLPYLQAAGIESLLSSATATGQVSVAIRGQSLADLQADAHFQNVKLSDSSDLIVMDNIELTGAGIDPTTGRLRIDNVAISGPTVNITRDPQGRLTFANLRWTPTRDAPLSEAAPAPVPQDAPPTTRPFIETAAMPRVEIGNLAWKNIKIQMRDEMIQPPSLITIDDAGLELKDFIFDLQGQDNFRPGTLRAWFNVPDLARQLSIEGTLNPMPQALSGDLKIRGEGLRTISLAPYLEPLGYEPLMNDGTLQANAAMTVAIVDQSLNVALRLSDANMNDGGSELGGVDLVNIEGAVITPTGLDIANVEITRPRIRVARDLNSRMIAMGFRMPRAMEEDAESSTTLLPLPVVIRKLQLTEASARWSDASIATPVDTSGRADLTLSGLNLAQSGSPANFRSVISMENSIDQLIVEGTIDPHPNALSLIASINATGVRAGALAQYLPPNIELNTTDGRFRADVSVNVLKNSVGGRSAKLSVENLSWRDGENAPVSLAFDSAVIDATRIDPVGNVIAFNEISVTGLQAQVERVEDGSIRIFDVHIAKGTSPTATQTTAAPPTTAPSVDLAQLISESRQPLPLVTVQKLDIQILKADLRDLQRPEAAPISFQDVALRNVDPIELGGENSEANPPVKLALSGAISPVVRNFSVDTSASPFAAEPVVAIDIRADGINGRGLIDVLPELRQTVNGDTLTEGQLRAKIESQMKFDRRGPRDFDLSRGFELNGTVTGPLFLESPDGQVVAGLDSIRFEQTKVTPRSGSIVARSIEITKPHARVYRDKDGIHALGMVIALAPTTKPATQPSESEQLPVQHEPEALLASSTSIPPEVASPTTQPAGGELRVDRLLITGLDVVVEDRAVTPQFIAPLNNLEMEVRGLTTRALTEPRTIRFMAVITSGQVRLPERFQSSGLAGAFEDLSADAGDISTTRPVSQRELFSQIAAAGRVALYPQPRGYIKTSVSGLEMGALEGIALERGFELHDGIFDGAVDVRFREDGALDTRSKLIITELRVAEPENGPVARHLALPASLDVVVHALEDPDGSITLPLKFRVPEDEITVDGIIEAAKDSLGGVIAPVLITAAGSTPLKAVDDTFSFFGLGKVFGGKKEIPDPVTIAFQPGSAYMSPEDRARLDALLQLAKADKTMQLTIRQELAPADVDVVAIRANPSREDALTLAAALRRRKFELEQRRSSVAGRMAGEIFASSVPTQSEATADELRGIDREIADIEQSMDGLFDLLRPGSERQAPRRTRAAAIDIAEQRLGAVREITKQAALTEYEVRVNITGAQFNPSAKIPSGQVVITPIVKGVGTDTESK